jgi:hypothetical protein
MSEELVAETPACRHRPKDLPSSLVTAPCAVRFGFPTNLPGIGKSPGPVAFLPARKGALPPSEMRARARDTIQYEGLYDPISQPK